MKENEKMTEKSIQYLKDYQAPDFTITHVSLSFSLDPKETKVSAKLKLVYPPAPVSFFIVFTMSINGHAAIVIHVIIVRT